MKLSDPTYPQTTSTVLKTPLQLATGAATNYPNTNPYAVKPQISLQYTLSENSTYPVANVCSLQGY